MKDKTGRVYELIACVILGVYSAVMIVYAAAHPTATNVTGMDSYTFPVTIYSIMLLICILLCAKNLLLSQRIKKKHQGMAEDEKTALDEESKDEYTFHRLDRRVVVSVGLIIAYAALWNIIGFTLSSVLFIVAESKALRREASWKACAAVTAAAVFLIHMVFVELFSINLPETFLKSFL